jgi:fucose permease
MPAFLERVRGVPRADATLRFGAVVVATGFAGTFAGGFLGDALLRRSRQAYLWLSGVATLLAVPLALAALLAPSPAVYMAAMVGAQLLLFASTGPVNSAIVGVVSPLDRATAVGLSILAIHAFGDVPSPILVGWLSDRAGLARAVTLVPAAVLIGGLVWCIAAWRAGRGGGPARGEGGG